MHFPAICRPKFQKCSLWFLLLGHLTKETKETVKKLNLWEEAAVDKTAWIQVCRWWEPEKQ